MGDYKWQPLNMEHLQSGFFGRKKKKLNTGDFVAITEGWREVDICHAKCAGQLIAYASLETGEPQETWGIQSLKEYYGSKSGFNKPLKVQHDLRCSICPKGWEYEDEKEKE